MMGLLLKNDIENLIFIFMLQQNQSMGSASSVGSPVTCGNAVPQDASGGFLFLAAYDNLKEKCFEKK